MKFYKKIKSKSTVKSFLVWFAFLSFFGLLVRASNIWDEYINDDFWDNLTNSGFLDTIQTNQNGLITWNSYETHSW